MTYRIELSSRAARDFKSLPRQIQERLKIRIDVLAENPRPPDVKKLVGEENQYRIRVGDYRLVYEIQDKVLLVLLLKIGHRRDVYR